jgi:hypothetical protein
MFLDVQLINLLYYITCIATLDWLSLGWQA